MKSKAGFVFLFLTILSGLVLTGCSGGSSPAGQPKQDVLTDLNGVDSKTDQMVFQDVPLDGDVVADSLVDTTENDNVDVGEGIDAGVDISGCPGNPECPCKSNDDCYSGFCIEGPDGNECAKGCSGDSECPDGYACKSVESGGGDVSYICVYLYPRLCMPCSEDTQCQGKFSGEGAKCIKTIPGVATDNTGEETITEVAFCGSACKGDGDCPKGYKCAAVVTVAGNQDKQCVPASGSCGCISKAKELNATGKCFKKNSFGECEGTFSCFKDKDASCDAAEPAKEECNGKDDDCDGETDEDFDLKTDINNCGQCGTVCTNDHGTTECKDGKCVPECDEGFGDCDNDPANGCETDLSTVESCRTCMTSKDCYKGFTCKQGMCVKQYPNGHSCDNSSDCAGGFCTAEGVCCDEACDGPCRSCKTGKCLPVINAEDPDTCHGNKACDANGNCKLKDGEPCTSNEDCLSGYCKEDFDSDGGAWCAKKIQCMHNTLAYNSGDFADICFNKTQRAKCVNGQWVAIGCGTDTPCVKHYCEYGECKTEYKGRDTLCDPKYKCSANKGDDYYGTGGDLRCQGFCDGHGNCDFASNCENCKYTFDNAEGKCNIDRCVISKCNWGFGDCDNNPSNGCETKLNNNGGICSNAENLGEIAGDQGARNGPSKTGRGNKWYKIYVREKSRKIRTIKFTAKLTLPKNVSYRLELYDKNCSTLLNSDVGGLNGGTISVHYEWRDVCCSDDDKWLYIHISYKDGSGCGQWTLSTIGGQ